MAVTWLSQPNSARSTTSRRRRLTSGPASQEAVAPPPVKLRPPATPYHSQLRRRSTGYRVASVDVVLDEGGSRHRSYALFSPYVPLPAIGGDASEEDKKEPRVMDGDDKDESGSARPRFLRERTYSVIEPLFVRGPSLQWAQPVRSNNGVWSRQAERALSPARPTPPHLPNLVAHHRRHSPQRLSTPEMLDDVQLPHDLDLDDDIFSEDLEPPEIVRKKSEANVRPSPLMPNSIEENRHSKFVTEVTDSLKRLLTRL